MWTKRGFDTTIYTWWVLHIYVNLQEVDVHHYCLKRNKTDTIWLFNIDMENHLF